MGALDKNSELTALGRIIARLPIDPIFGRTIALAAALGYFYFYFIMRFYDCINILYIFPVLLRLKFELSSAAK